MEAKAQDAQGLHDFCTDSCPPEYRSLNEQGMVVLLVRIEADGYGVGWSVVGFSAISRCPKTYGQDGFSANVLLTTADLYRLDGNKLRSFAGTTYAVPD